MLARSLVMKGILCAVFYTVSITYAQDHSFSQPFFSQLYLNPAYAGSTPGMRVAMNYRNQWTNVPSKFETFNLGVDIQSIQLLSGGIGMSAYRNVEGEGRLSTMGFQAMYAYHLLVNKNFNINFGTYSGVMVKSIDWEKLQFTDQFHPVSGLILDDSPGFATPLHERVAFLDIGAGVLFRFNIPIAGGKKYINNEIGYSAGHINKPEESLMGGKAILPFKQIWTLNMWIPVSEWGSRKPPMYLSPKLVIEDQAEFRTFITSLYIQRAPIFGGFSYRNRQPFNNQNTDAFIFHMGAMWAWADLAANSIISYSYDFNVHGLSSPSAGTHEISLLMTFGEVKISRKDRRKTRKDSKCYSFNPNEKISYRNGMIHSPVY